MEDMSDFRNEDCVLFVGLGLGLELGRGIVCSLVRRLAPKGRVSVVVKIP